jgi:hypothetical protein
MQRIRETTNSLKVFGKLTTTATIRVKDEVSAHIGSIKDKILSVKGLTVAALGIAGGSYAAKSIFDKTIGASAQMELSESQIKAMARNDDLASGYVKMMQDKAIASPVLSTQQMFANGTTFLSTFKDLDSLEKAWSISEKLIAKNPLQGVDGAVFAMRELLNGDSTSMSERFDLPKKELNEIKALDPKKQLDALEKWFDKLGYTNEFVANSAKTAIGQWNQIGEKISTGMQKMGVKALEKLKPELERFNNWLDTGAANRIIDFGSRMLSGLTNAAINGFNRVEQYIQTHYLQNETFNNLSVTGKVKFVIDDLMNTFDNWYDSGGKEQITSIGGRVVGFLADSISAAAPSIASAGLSLGGALGSAFVNSFESTLDSHPIVSTLLAAGAGYMAMPGPPMIKAAGAIAAVGTVWGKKAIDAILQDSDDRLKRQEEARSRILNGTGTQDQPMFGNSVMTTEADIKIKSRKEKEAGHNATGTPYWKGGLSWVGEKGPELVNLPQGSQVIPNDKSMAMASSGGNVIYININGVSKSTREIMNEMVPELKLVLANL